MQEVYLVRAELYNFQSHLHTEADFADGFNLLAGSSNSGKSGLLRGILWNVLNEPSGDDFIKRGENEAVVITHWSNGYSIERRKNKGGSKNFYILYKDGELVNEYTGFGTNVPPEIVEAHGIRPLTTGVYFNYANQLESAFMISSSPKVRAETIGNLEELGRIDEELARINDDIRLDRAERKRLDKEIATLEKEVDVLERKVSLEEKKITTLRTLKSSVEEKELLVQGIENHLMRLRHIEQEVSEQSAIVAKSMRIVNAWDDTLPNKINTFKQISSSINRLVEIRSELDNIQFINDQSLKRLEELVHFVDATSSQYQQMKQLSERLIEIKTTKDHIRSTISERVAALDFSLLDKDVEKFRFVFKELGRLRTIRDEVENNQQVVNHSSEQIEKLLNQFVEILQQEELCPTCSQTTKDVTSHDIEKIV